MPSNVTAKIKSALRGRAFAVVLAAGILVSLAFWLGDTPSRSTLQVGEHTYTLERARTAEQQERGLSGRMTMPQDKGMVFVFDTEKRACFWMKDMHFSLDIIWLDAQRRVVHVKKDVSPLTFPEAFCANNTQYVIELRAGEADKSGIRKGQILQF